MPLVKKTAVAPKEPVAPPVEPEIEVGSWVKWEEEGEGEKVGQVIELKKKSAIIQCGEDMYETNLVDLTITEEPEAVAEAEETEPAKPVKPAGKRPSNAPKGKGSSLAAIYNKSKPAPDGGGGGFPKGKWQALIISGELEEVKEGGIRALFHLVGVGDDEVEGKKGRLSYVLVTPEGEEAEGMQYFKRDLVKLGLEDVEFSSEDEITEALETIGNNETWVNVSAVPQKTNTQYTNIFLDSVEDDQSAKPERPPF